MPKSNKQLNERTRSNDFHNCSSFKAKNGSPESRILANGFGRSREEGNRSSSPSEPQDLQTLLCQKPAKRNKMSPLQKLPSSGEKEGTRRVADYTALGWTSGKGRSANSDQQGPKSCQ